MKINQKTFKTKKSIQTLHKIYFVTIDVEYIEFGFFSLWYNKQFINIKTEDLDKKFVLNILNFACDKNTVKSIIDYIKDSIK